MLSLLLAVAVAQEPTVSWDALAAVHGLDATFTQTQHRSWLTEPLISTGTLSFQRPATLQWSVLEPTRSTLVWRDGTVSLSGVGQTAVDIDIDDTPEAARWVQALTVWLSGDVAAIERSFAMTYVPNGVVLTPRDDAMKAHMATMALTVADSGQWIERVVITERDSDTMTIELSNVTVRPAPDL